MIFKQTLIKWKHNFHLCSTLKLKQDLFILCWGWGCGWEILKNHPARSVTLATEAGLRIGRHTSVPEAVPKQNLLRSQHLPAGGSTLSPPSSFTHWVTTWALGAMGTPNDQAVLQAIFNPDTPFGDVVGLDLEEAEEGDEGEPLTLVSTPP